MRSIHHSTPKPETLPNNAGSSTRAAPGHHSHGWCKKVCPSRQHGGWIFSTAWFSLLSVVRTHGCRVVRQIVLCIKYIFDVMLVLFFMTALFALMGWNGHTYNTHAHTHTHTHTHTHAYTHTHKQDTLIWHWTFAPCYYAGYFLFAKGNPTVSNEISFSCNFSMK